MKKREKITRFTVVFILIVTLLSCTKIEELKIGDVRQVSFTGIHDNVISLKITVPIENPNTFSIRIREADLYVNQGDNELGKVKQIDDIFIPAKSAQEYTVNINIELTNIKDIMTSAMMMFSGGVHDLHLSGTIMASSFLYNRKIKIENFSLVK